MIYVKKLELIQVDRMASYVTSFIMKRNSGLIPFNSLSKNMKINKTESKFVITHAPSGWDRDSIYYRCSLLLWGRI